MEVLVETDPVLLVVAAASRLYGVHDVARLLKRSVPTPPWARSNLATSARSGSSMGTATVTVLPSFDHNRNAAGGSMGLHSVTGAIEIERTGRGTTAPLHPSARNGTCIPWRPRPTGGPWRLRAGPA